jgi:hypothetical protein
MRAPLRPSRTLVRGALALAAAALLAGCVPTAAGAGGGYGEAMRVGQVVRILRVDEPSPAFYRERARLEALGPELDRILLGLALDEAVDENVRANALVLLADRRTPGVMPLLRRELAASPSDVVRAAAVQGLQRYALESPEARNALRAAIGDPAAAVRLNVLQGLDVEDAPLVRAQLEREPDGQVRTIARQLLELLEARGAPLVRDERGELRAGVREGAPRLVFHPTWSDTVAGIESGALWVELPNASLLPLAQEVEVVGRIVPAFFDPTRSAVVYEAGREIFVRDLATGRTGSFGAGIAPRAIPFTGHFVFAREAAGGRVEEEDGTTVALYHLFLASFGGGAPMRMGSVEAHLHPTVRGGTSPLRVMVVAEGRGGFVLRAQGMTPVALPGPVLAPSPPP